MDEMADKIHETVTHARNLCDNVQWSPMDATRTEHDYLCRVVEIAIRAGASTINIPDTVGYTAPKESADLIRMLIEKVPGTDEVIFATHCHMAWRRRTPSPRLRPGRVRSNVPSTVWANARATPHWKRS
jgi:2-isopropylmalate synthase